MIFLFPAFQGSQNWIFRNGEYHGNWTIVQKQIKSSVKYKLENLFQCANHWASTTLNIPSLDERKKTNLWWFAAHNQKGLFCLYWPIENENCSFSCTQFWLHKSKKTCSIRHQIFYFIQNALPFTMISICTTIFFSLILKWIQSVQKSGK